MQMNDIYNKYKDRSVKKIDAETKDIILDNLSSIQEISNVQDANHFIEVLALCRGAQAAMDGEKRNNTFRTLLSTGEEGAYVENNSYINERFMYELIQNVDDCKYKSIDDCKLKIDFDINNDIITLKYNELGFRPKDVIAISDIGNSTKNHHKSLDQKETGLDKNDFQEIGEKGIGFKSIFGLANKVSIKSGYFNFYFDYADFTIPKISDETNNTRIDGTILTIFLKKGIAKQLYKMLQNKYQENSTIITENPVLFLNKLTEITYCSNDNYFGFRVTRSTDKPNINGELMEIEYLSSNKKNQRTIQCYHYSKEITYSIDECKSRFGDDEDKERKYKIEIITSADVANFFYGRIYSFFPTEQELTVPMIVQAPFKLDSGRTNIANQSDTADSTNLWFVRTKNETINFIHHVCEDLAKKIGFKIVNFIPDFNLVDSNRCPLYDSRLARAAFLELNLFESVAGDFLPADKIYILNKNVKKLEDVIDTYNLLNLKQPLLKYNIEPKKALSYGFHMLNNIDDKLFDFALKNPGKTEQCLKYLEDYSIKDFKGERQYLLNESQIIQLKKYSIIIQYINSQTIEYLKKNDNSILFKFVSTSENGNVDLERIRKYCHENDDHLNGNIINYIDSVSCDQDDIYDHSIFLTNYVFSSNVVDALNTLLGKIDKKYKNFFSFIRFDEVEKTISNLINDDTDSDDEFLKKITDIRDEQRRILGNQYKNIITLINQSGTKPERFLMELLQNIDDANYIEEPYVDIYYQNNQLVLNYNETGFTKENIVAITAIGDSTKQYLANENITGEKGIGFKSIFNVANTVEIHSNNFHFKLTDKEPTIPIRIKEKEFTVGTKMIIEVKNGYIDNYFNDKFLVDTCLCLKQIKHLRINRKRMIIQELPNKRIVQYGNEHVFYKFIYKYQVEQYSVRRERYENVEATKNQQITYLIPLESQRCNIYSTFPTSELMKVPVIIDANFKLNTSRESILEDNRWNTYTIAKIHDGFLWMLEQIKRVDYKKMMEIIPYDGYLTSRLSNDIKLDEKIRRLPIFMVFNSDNKFIPLNDGFIGTKLDKYIIGKWGYFGNKVNRKIREDCIDFDIKQITYDRFYKKPSFVDRCKDLYDSKSYNIIHPKYMQDDTFRTLLYDYFLSYDYEHIENDDFEKIRLANWEIIPVTKNKITTYIKYSNNIYYSYEDNIRDHNTINLLDCSKMKLNIFRKIYSGSKRYVEIQKYSESFLLDDMARKINQSENYYDPIFESEYILNLYKNDPQLFKDCIKRREQELNLDLIYLITRTGRPLHRKDCYIPYKNERDSVLDYVIVSERYLELAKTLSIPCVKEIDNVKNIYDFFTYDSLNKLFDLESIRNNKRFFDQIYLSMFDYGYDKYIKNEVFIKLINNIDNDTVAYKEWNFKIVKININTDCLRKYGKTFVSIYNKYSNFRFVLSDDIKLSEFDHPDLLNDIRGDLTTRKLDDKIKISISLLDHCYYCENLGESIVPLRVLMDNEIMNILLINQSITAEYDIIDVFKDFFLKNFSLSINVTMDAEKYTRGAYESISTIDYSEIDERIATQRAAKEINFDDISEIKDFMCKPLSIYGKVIGGYARTCPICGAKVRTELTGMRLYKFKNKDEIFEFISCPNCYENLRYSSKITIDSDDLNDGYLSFEASVCGEVWSVKHVKIRLGHKAVLNVINKRK